MKYLRLLIIATVVAKASCAQGFYIGVFGGTSNYTGDLTNQILPKNQTKGAMGISGNFPLNPHFSLRAGLTHALITGADKYADDPSRVRRNLSFESKLTELSFIGEVYLLDLETISFSPYGFVGAALFHFNPYAYDTKGQKVFLRPLSTEGQGLSAYPDRKPYNLYDFAIPYGGGIKVKVNEKMKLGFEVGLRKLFTEYIDDVSSQYVNWETLMEAKGPQAVEMAYRGDELDQGIGNSIIPYPPEGTLRGDPAKNDSYYFSGIHVSYLLNGEDGSRPGRIKYGRNRSRMGCPTNVY